MYELQPLEQTVRIISKDIVMEFGMDRCTTVRIKKGKICDMEYIEMPDRQRMKQIAKSGYRYLGIINVMKKKIRTGHLRGVRKLELEIGIVCKRFVYGDKSVGGRCSNVQCKDC